MITMTTRYEHFIGKKLDDVIDEIKKNCGLLTEIRKPGFLYAEQYRNDRLQIHIDEHKCITEFHVG